MAQKNIELGKPFRSSSLGSDKRRLSFASSTYDSRSVASALSTYNKIPTGPENVKERNKTIVIFQEQSGKNEDWNKKYIHSTMFLLGYGAYGCVFQVTTRLYPQSRLTIAKERYIYHPNFLARYAAQRKVRIEHHEKMKDRFRYERLFDTVAIKYELLEQSQLEDGVTRFYLFLRREFLVLDTLWRKFPRLLAGFPVVFDFGYLGDKLQYGVNPKYKNIFTYLNLQGEEVKFFADTHNRNLEGVTKISYMAMELVGPSIEDYRSYFEPWYSASRIRPFFQVRTAFRIADQVMCRLYLLHKAGFVHHDLKPDNLAVGSGRALNTIYLLDYGFAKQVSDCNVSEWMGSRKFISVDTFNGEKPNFAQDIESWFYLVMVLLFDSLPWSDEVIAPMLSPTAEEGARWAMVIAIKKTWWGEWRSATTLHSMLNGLESLHKQEVPDIRQIVELLHRKVRDLRAHLRQISDAKTLNSELANSQSIASKGYMSVRKVLLQIFRLPNIGKNILLGDLEFKAYQEMRNSLGLEPFRWDQGNFDWEWDRNHSRMVDSSREAGSEDALAAMGVAFQLGGGGGSSDELVPSEAHNTDTVQRHLRRLAASLKLTAPAATSPEDRRLRMRVLGRTTAATEMTAAEDAAAAAASPTVGRPPQRPDEVSYVYDRAANCLVPKCAAVNWKRRESWTKLGKEQNDEAEAEAEAEAELDAKDLWRLANPSCIL